MRPRTTVVVVLLATLLLSLLPGHDAAVPRCETASLERCITACRSANVPRHIEPIQTCLAVLRQPSTRIVPMGQKQMIPTEVVLQQPTAIDKADKLLADNNCPVDFLAHWLAANAPAAVLVISYLSTV